jgi:hypothetical protein
MKVFSRLNLLNNALITDSGNVFNRLFESKYVTLSIRIPKMELIRGKALVADVNETLHEYNLEVKEYNLEIDEYNRLHRTNRPKKEFIKQVTLEGLIGLLYTDFLRQVKDGTNLHTFAQLISRKKNDLEELNQVKVRDLVQKSPYKYVMEDRAVRYSENPMMIYSVKIYKKAAWRGEVLLYDMSQLVPGFDVTLEELIAIRYQDVMNAVKTGNTNIFDMIIANLKDS